MYKEFLKKSPGPGRGDEVNESPGKELLVK